MSTQSQAVDLVGGKIEFLTGGEGPPLLILHRDIGRPAWGALQERLARSFRVIIPSLPGFEHSERPDWLRNVSDLAAVIGQFIDKLAIGPANIVGLGFGGWVAAELAARDPSRIARLFLHAPVGIKPTEGEITDFVLWETMSYIRLGFASQVAHDELLATVSADQRDHWENNREMVLRLAWKPYMYNPSLPHLLKAATVPTLITWSVGDKIVPRSAASLYAEALPNSQFVEFSEGGHHADVETPDLVAQKIEEHFGVAAGANQRAAVAAKVG